ncbi:MAG TPA: AAA family ATPase [Azoarcus taiwanensis]|nr:AAA family ATPase [Azoarcus taiwanensis]
MTPATTDALTADPVGFLKSIEGFIRSTPAFATDPATLKALAELKSSDPDAAEAWISRVASAAKIRTNDLAGKVGAVRRTAIDIALWPDMSGSVQPYLDTPPPEIHWAARLRLLANRAHVMVGMGGTSKTRVLYHLGFAFVIGRLAWDWQIDRTGSAMLFLAEDTADNVHRTIAALVKHMHLTDEERQLIADRLIVFPLAGKDTRLLVNAGGGVLIETDLVPGLIARCKAVPDLRFIGFDPALALTEGDELNQAHQRMLGALMDRIAIELDACVVMTAHAAKSLQNADEIGSHTSRGGGAITDAVRGEFTLRTMTEREGRTFGITDPGERKAHVQLLATKGNEIPPVGFQPVWLKRGTDGVLHQVELTPAEADPVGFREIQALEILRRMAKEATPQLREWRAACIDADLIAGPTPKARERAMERITKALLSARMIERGHSSGVYLPSEK